MHCSYVAAATTLLKIVLHNTFTSLTRLGCCAGEASPSLQIPTGSSSFASLSGVTFSPLDFITTV